MMHVVYCTHDGNGLFGSSKWSNFGIDSGSMRTLAIKTPFTRLASSKRRNL